MNIINLQKLTFYIFLNIILGEVNSQTLKTYNGKFESGTATYQYYDNEKYDRIFNGSFSYWGASCNMTGFFSNNQRNDKWNIYAQNKIFTGWRGTLLINTKIYGLYNNDKLEGPWSYSNSMCFYDEHNKKCTGEEDKEYSTANFKNNIFIGSYYYEEYWPKKFIAKGQFDNSGYTSGSWSTTEKLIKKEIKYLNGVEYWRLERNITTGEKITFKDSTKFVHDYWANFDTMSCSSLVNGKLYSHVKILPRSGPWVIWQSNDVYVYESGYLPNPLYYYKKEILKPECYQNVIVEGRGNWNKMELLDENEKNKINTYICNAKEKVRKDSIMHAQIKREQIEEKKRQDSIANEVKFNFEIKKGDSVFYIQKYKDALYFYQSAYKIKQTDATILKINNSQYQIKRIDSLQNLKLEAFTYINNIDERINKEKDNLFTTLLEIKKLYAENYINCMNKLNGDLSEKKSEIKKTFNDSSTLDNTWSESDQQALNMLMELKNSYSNYAKFHSNVKIAAESNNKDKLKFLSSSKNIDDIISKFI